MTNRVTRIATVLGSALLLVTAAGVGPTSAATSRTLTAKSTPTAALAGTQVTIAGKLSSSPKGSTVRIQRYNGSSWITSRTTTTGTGGAYTGKVTLPSTPKAYKYRAYAPATRSLASAKSATLTVTALRKTRFNKIFGTSNDFVLLNAKQGDPSAANGSLASPYTAGAKVVVQRRPGSGSPWATLASSTIQSSGAFEIPFDNAQSGEYRIVVSRKGLNSSAVSRTQSYVFTP